MPLEWQSKVGRERELRKYDLCQVLFQLVIAVMQLPIFDTSENRLDHVELFAGDQAVTNAEVKAW